MIQILHGKAASDAIMAGSQKLYDAVKETYGPVSGNVGILKKFAGLDITHDGVTVAKSIELEGAEQVGAEVIRKTATQMDDKLGDGTTTVTILAHNILKEAHDLMAAGASPLVLKRQLEADAITVLEQLQKLSVPTADKASIAEVATISSGDPEIGKLVADVVDVVGKDGSVTVEEGTNLTIEKDIVEGFTFDKGYLSPYMVDDAIRMEAILSTPSVFITSQKITRPDDALKIIKKAKGSKGLLLIASDISEEIIGSLVMSKTQGILNIVAVKAPGFAGNKLEILKDIASLVGTTVVEDLNTDLSSVLLGTANKVTVSSDKTTIISDGKSDQAVKERLAFIDEQIKAAKSDYEKENFIKRKGALAGKVAVIKVGGFSETEIDEKKYRVDDAVYAAIASLDGTVPGGATTLLDLSKTLDETSILKHALKAPFKILMENSGYDAAVYIDQAGDGMGVDVKAHTELINLRDAGIIEPTKTIEQAIKSAVSVAGTAMTMKAIVFEKEDKKHDEH